MKQFFTTIFLMLALVLSSLAQNEVIKPAEISTATYFDISPPLRDMPVIPAGKRDRSWKDGVIKNKLDMPEYRDLPLPEATPEDYSTAQTRQGDRDSELLLSVNGVGNLSYVLPPDTQGDVGPNHYMQMVNSSFAIWNKTGNIVYGPVDNKTLWNGFPGPWSGSNDGDPIVLYDEQADRWIASQFALPNYPNGPFYEMIAVSQTGDPTGSWYRYAFTFTNMPDYPKLGVWRDGYYLAVNSFTSGSLNWAGTGVAALDRTKMLAGDPTASMIFFTTPSGGDPSTFLPADCDGAPAPAGAPALFGYMRDGNPDRLVLYQLHADWTTPSNATFTQLVTLPVQSFSSSISGIPQKNTSVKLDELSGRLMYRLQYRNFGSYQSMVTNHTVNVAGHAGVRWYELRDSGSGWQIYQQGTYSPDDTYRWMGSIAMNSYGDMALGFSASSTLLFPSIRFTGRRANDPLGEMTVAEQDIVAGGGSQNSSWERWGDYSMMSVDPAADTAFWYTQEYYTSTSDMNWKTRIGSFTFGTPLTATASASTSQLCAGESCQLNVQVSGAGAGVTYEWSSNPAGFSSDIPNPTVTPDVTTEYTVTVTSGGNFTTSAVSITVFPLPSVAAPDELAVCAGSVITINSIPFNHDSIQWVGQGDGVFENPNAARTDYTPGPQDIANGSVMISVTVYSDFGCSPAEESVLLTINAMPVADAGLSVETCEGVSVQLAGTASAFSSVLWTTAGTGSFNDPTLANAMYTPSADDFLAGSVDLTFTVVGNTPCGDTTDVMTITFVASATVEAGSDVTICAGQAVATSASGSGYSTLLWTSSGDGQFVNSSSLAASYQPGPADISSGQAVLTISAIGIGSCEGANDQLLVTINPLANVFAGNDTIICKTSSILIGGTATNASSTMWSTSGNGTFDNANILNTRYLPGTQDTINGSVALTLTAISQFGCDQVVDQKNLEFAQCLGVESLSKATIRILPNPTTGKFSVEIEGLPRDLSFRLNVTNATGESIVDSKHNNSSGSFKTIIDLSSQAKGIYLLMITTGAEMTTAKIILH